MIFRLKIICIVYFLTHAVCAQNTFTENFNTENALRSWNGDTSHFIIENAKLKLSAPEGSTESKIQHDFEFLDLAEWHFSVSVLFSPSASNYTEIILAENADERLYCRIGENGSNDGLELLYNSENETTSIGRIDDGMFSSTFEDENIQINYTEGEWTIASPYSTVEFNFPVNLRSFNSFGIYCKYTATRRDKFLFDSIYVYSEVILDTSGPQLTDIETKFSGSTIFSFNESLGDVLEFTLNGKEPLNFIKGQDQISFQFLSAEEEIAFYTEILDSTGNVSVIDSAFSLPIQDKGSVLITEIMPDPEPPLFLPNTEYIEIYNTTENAINLKGWRISDANSASEPFPEFELNPEEVVILAPAGSESLFSDEIKILSVDGWPSLNNTEDRLSLSDSNGIKIHNVFYNTSLIETSSDGGKSLELMSSSQACPFNAMTWKESEDLSGGSPGTFQSTEVETVLPEIHFQHNKNGIKATLSNPGSGFTLVKAELKPENTELNRFYWETPDTLKLYFNEVLPEGSIQNLELSYLNCQLDEIQVKKEFLIPEELTTESVLINEFLINGRESIDFIEFINTSQNPILSNQIVLSEIENEKIVTTWRTKESVIIRPGEVWVWTPDKILLENTYTVPNPEKVQEVNFNLTAGINLSLYSEEGVLLDDLNTAIPDPDNWLNSPDDASWERVSVRAESQSPENWAPATSSVNFATPTAENSQARSVSSTDLYKIETRIIRSRSLVATEQQVEIVFSPKNNNTYVNAYIFNRNGHKIKDLALNKLLGSGDRIFWNGKDENNQQLPTNMYLLFLEVYSLDGDIQNYKESVVID